MKLLKHTIYINLEHRTDRRERIESHLKELGIENAERFHAIQTKSGAIGCSLSHLKCLELAKERKWSHVFICEDDFYCVKPTIFQKSIQTFEENYKKDHIQWDVLLIGGNNCPPCYKPEGVQYCVQITNCQTTVGYVVAQHFYDILIMNIREGVERLIQFPENKKDFAIDIYWKRLQHSGKWYLLIPLTITQYISYSDIEETTKNYDHLMLDLEKQWLFPTIPKMNLNPCFPMNLYS